MPGSAKKPAQLEDVSGWMAEFQNETDRGAALLGAAFLDEQLKEVLRQFLVPAPRAIEKLLGVDRPLGTFSSRILATYLLGLITREWYADIDLVRKIRNHFAHHLHGTTFADQKVAGWCSSLMAPNRLDLEYRLTSRDRFVLTSIHMSIWLNMQAMSIGKDRREALPEPKYGV